MIPVITVDGPSGSGKGTISQLLARELGWHYLDSGAIYRVLAYSALQHQIALDDEEALANLAAQLQIKFEPQAHGAPKVIIDSKEVTEVIRTELIGNTASRIGAFAAVRTALLACQRAFRQAPGLVTDGRDMGSIIFPDAPLKIFLLASPQERARRRYQQLKERGISVSLDALCNELIERDKRDQERAVAPLKPMPDAIIIDTTQISINDVLQKVKDLASKVFSLHKR